MDLVKINPFQNVGANQLATTQFEPEGPASLFGILLKLGGTTFDETHIDSLTLKHSGKTLLPGVTGARWRDVLEYEGLTFDAAYIPLLFGDPTARTAKGQHLGNFDFTRWPGRMTIEVDIGGATAPTLDAWAILSPPKSLMGLGYTDGEAMLHRALVETVLQPAAAVQKKAFDIGMGSEAGALLKRLMFFHANITELQVKRSGFDIYEDIPVALSASWQDDIFTRVPQAGLEVYDPIVDGNYSEVKTTVDPTTGRPYNYQVRLTTSAADTITAYADLLTLLPRL